MCVSQVSDFGLTKFREEFKRTDNKELQGSVHWTAPEILNEVMDADLMEADVYSFGIILWELCTRQQPYMGMRYTNTSERLTYSQPLAADSSLCNYSSAAAVAVAVIRDNMRPPLPDDDPTIPAEFIELVRTCWHSDPTFRPSFLVRARSFSPLATIRTAQAISLVSVGVVCVCV